MKHQLDTWTLYIGQHHPENDWIENVLQGELLDYYPILHIPEIKTKVSPIEYDVNRAEYMYQIEVFFEYEKEEDLTFWILKHGQEL